jgi:predicted polyphosphate/ATP-dependent NAD kinase
MILGLLINPIAGMGGRVGLKGTDGVVDEAIRRGAKPIASSRALEFLIALCSLIDSGLIKEIQVITCPGIMGAEVVFQSCITPEVIDIKIKAVSTAEDTRKCVLSLYESGVRLLVFVGGDGTARDILDAANQHKLNDLLVLGVPSGVKMYSGLFVVNPRDAAEVVRLTLEGTAKGTEFEIMDADEAAIREDRFAVRLYGYLKGPSVPARFQGAKQASPETIDEREAQEAIANFIIESMEQDGYYILGPGTTVRTLAETLYMKKTTLGVDVFHQGAMFNDVNEDKILELINDFSNTWIIVSPIGHQGMLFGRGNQQISSEVIKRVGRDHIIIICTPAKLRDLEGGALKVDTGDSDVDDMLRGYIRVITDYNEFRLVQIE